MRQRARISTAATVALMAVMVMSTTSTATGQCTELTSGLQLPLGITQSNLGNLVVTESGTRTPNTGRISIIDPGGSRRTLVSGLPSAINDVNDPSGPAGLFMRGRTLYVVIGVGDVSRPGPFPGTDIVNPNPVSSPLFSSVLELHFSAKVEKSTTGFTLTLADQQTLAAGGTVTLADGSEKLTIRVVADFPNYIPNPLPTLPAGIRHSNPFDVVAVANQLYVTDGGRNLVWQVDIPSGSFFALAEFPPVPNPLFPALGGPTSEAVPTGIRSDDGQLLVALFRGAPFAPGASTIEQVDPATGSHSAFITGLKTAIDVQPVTGQGATEYLVLQHASAGPFFGSPGLLLRFPTPAGPPAVVANCMTRPTSMAFEAASRTAYVTEFQGRLLAIGVP